MMPGIRVCELAGMPENHLRFLWCDGISPLQYLLDSPTPCVTVCPMPNRLRRVLLLAMTTILVVLGAGGWLLWPALTTDRKGDPMDQFRRETADGNVVVELLTTVPADNRWDEYREVRLQFPDGRSYNAGFFRDPRERGGHWWDEPGMVIVQDLTTEQVMAAVDEILRRGAIEDAFIPIHAVK
jgi:hypothetical protein